MSADGSIDLTWLDGEDKFRLRIGEIRQLQEKCGAGLEAVRKRLRSGDWYVDDIRETIRLGLIGAGMAPADAMKKVMRSVDQAPLIENVIVAHAILTARSVGVDGDPVGKQAAGEAETEAMDASPSPPSMEAAQ